MNQLPVTFLLSHCRSQGDISFGLNQSPLDNMLLLDITGRLQSNMHNPLDKYHKLLILVREKRTKSKCGYNKNPFQ